MDTVWIVVFILFCGYKIFNWNSKNKHIREYEAQREELKLYTDKATADNPELVGQYWNPNRNPVSREVRSQVLLRTEGHCFYCDCNLSELPRWQVDHVWPYRYGGSEELINLVPSCEACNVEKWSHLPPRYFMHKWVTGRAFTSYEIKLLEHYRDNSLANLIGTSAHWKGKADYWNATIFSSFVDLITQNESIKHATGKRRLQLIKEAEAIFTKLDCDVASKSVSYRTIESWLDWEAIWSDIKSEGER